MSDNPNTISGGTVMGASPMQPTPTEIELQQPEYPPGILPIRMLKVAGVAFGPQGMTQAEADDRLLALNDPPPAPVLHIANMDDPTSQTLSGEPKPPADPPPYTPPDPEPGPQA